jgi:hypothetical protein
MEQALIFFFEYKLEIFIIALSIFVGIEVISNVPAVLHTPLMSGCKCNQRCYYNWWNYPGWPR